MKRWMAVTVLILSGAATSYAAPQAITAHSITVSWVPSVSTGVTSQIVYRATAATGPWAALTTIPNNTTSSFVDTTAVVGTTYYYEIDAAINITLSGPSNTTNATEPANPLPPSGANAVAQ